ncbi:type II toxin-antitoxin system RelE/ParE family toxin [Pasteurella multocida]|uniref:Type II toxin-antitoxin system RelE/ParE family toxin n=1 Tax=Pasteurella multocida TaxID=747 RepID=A0AAW8VAV3_PASMD|nr:type II toxin-antitoxin system RelE/ParE family toxin [Pasteurella multocida]MDH7438603.1 type II toxin-antitoxin system RelE/ParE family toxin [Pasteurella multocida]MDH7441071.1 type II toxin-antitoxin system RelE/ParE family toxin [Pasteurella multocida]MDT3453596.1 type II toxin-antitoxin system RelE/ParE family toxin [Pasteurella multocida]MDY0431069.1 type II toxin-antitoxin system RelE/ParE family toxin [Pasteurella multocida]MDY0433576.1 type II toxin-antitoxin system RelE/ParE fami
MNQINWTKKAIKQLLSIDQRYVKSIREKVNALNTFPDVKLDLKKMSGKDNQYRLRVGDYRVLFEVIDGEPRIINIQTVKRRTSTTY